MKKAQDGKTNNVSLKTQKMWTTCGKNVDKKFFRKKFKKF